MSDLPTLEEVRTLHEKYAPSQEAFDLVFTHCGIVAEVARQLLPVGADPELVRVGCLLHDIGVYRLYDPTGLRISGDYITHGVLGHEILKAEGLPEEVCRFCSHHTGVGLTKQDIVEQNLPLPVADYLAESTEERLVMYADTFHSKSTPPRFVGVAESRGRMARFGEEKARLFDELVGEFGVPDLSALTAGD